MMKNVVIIIEREGKRVESLPIPNRTDIGIFGSFDSTWWWKKRIPFLFFFFIVVVITIDTCYMYACAYLMRCAAQRTNEKNSFVFFLIRFHFCLVVVVIFYLFFCFVSLCFVLWLSFRLENNESRSIHGYFTRHTHTEREFKWARSSYSHGLRKRQEIRDDAHEMKRNEKQISISINRS